MHIVLVLTLLILFRFFLRLIFTVVKYRRIEVQTCIVYLIYHNDKGALKLFYWLSEALMYHK